MLINATRPTEVRAAILQDGRLEQFEFETEDAGLLKGNVYKGRIANVEASLNACFVEFGQEKQGFLPVDDIAPRWYQKGAGGEGRPRIEDLVRRGQEIVVQVVKDAQGNKGAALTSFVSLAGRYIVLMPLDDVHGVSRKISDEKQRKEIKEVAEQLKIPKECGFIIRTAGTERNKTELNRDAAELLRTWKDIEKNFKRAKVGALLHQDGDLVVRMLRDHYTSDIAQIIIDDRAAYERAAEFFRTVMPRSKRVLTGYMDKAPLFSKYRVEDQVEAIFGRRVDLRSGGYILIDHAEALIAVDVNSGRSTRQKSQEETALHTNLEAAAEVARQLRLRDLGGLIVVDFIDMALPKHNRQVEKALKDAFKTDKARTYVGRISDNGLLEINRQRLKQSVQLQTHRPCPTCDGRGIIPSTDQVALKILRIVEAKAADGGFGKVAVSLHPELADHVQNAHRRDLVDLEERFGVLVEVQGRPGMHRNEQELKYVPLGELSEAERRMVVERREAMAEAERTARVRATERAEEPPEFEEGTEEDFEGAEGRDDGEDFGDAGGELAAEAAEPEAGLPEEGEPAAPMGSWAARGAATDGHGAVVEIDFDELEPIPMPEEEDETVTGEFEVTAGGFDEAGEGGGGEDGSWRTESGGAAGEGEAPGEGGSRKRRRRRRRRGRGRGEGDGQPGAVAGAQAAADAGRQGDSQASEHSGGQRERQPRHGGRRDHGRHHGQRNGQPNGQHGGHPHLRAQAGGPPETGGEQGGNPSDSQGNRRRRRRRRGGRGRSHGGGPGAAGGGSSQEAGGNAQAGGPSGDSGSGPSESAAAAPNIPAPSAERPAGPPPGESLVRPPADGLFGDLA
jgi:ribonuclease E